MQGKPSRRSVLRSTLGATLGASSVTAMFTGCAADDPPPDLPPVPDDDDDREAQPRPPIPATELLLRVRVARGQRPDRTAIEIGSDDRRLELTLFERARTAFASRPPAVAVFTAPVQVTRTDGRWRLRDALGLEHVADGSRILELRPLGPDVDDVVALDGARYPGLLRIVPRNDGTSDIVNHVRLESYLPGVLARELFPHWPIETFAAQAVAARSYAASEHAYFAPRRHYDVTNTTTSQVYLGLAGGERAVDAVRRTRGLYLAWDGALVPGYYSSCCGGLSADARDAIGPHPFNDVPPLRGQTGADPCNDAPLYRWSRERDARRTLTRVRAWGASRRRDPIGRILELRAIDVDTTNDQGRPRTYRVAALFAPADPTLGDAFEDSVVLSAEALRSAIDFGSDDVAAPETRLPSSHIATRRSGQELIIDGRGHGHGVGLCQYGARALAERGLDYEQILQWYYPGADLQSGS